MDMNFPHTHRERVADKVTAAGSFEGAEHKSLLARAIARQAASRSAKYFGAARQASEITGEAVWTSLMDERMAFFAGRLGTGFSGSGCPKLFRAGCFRPDLAQQELDKMHS